MRSFSGRRGSRHARHHRHTSEDTPHASPRFACRATRDTKVRERMQEDRNRKKRSTKSYVPRKGTNNR